MKRNWVWAGAVAMLVIGLGQEGRAGDRPVVRAQGGMVYPESQPMLSNGPGEYPVYGGAAPGGYPDAYAVDPSSYPPDAYLSYPNGEFCDECDHCPTGHCFWHCSVPGKCHYCLHYIFTLGGRQSNFSRINQGRQPRNPTQLDFEYRYRYRAPKDLVYPPANQPAGVVVYPYYTLKGPDDFFLQTTP